MTAEKLILKYWNSWQVPSDFDEMEGCLDPNISMTVGSHSITSAAQFRAFVEANPAPWRDVRLVDSMFTADAGAIIYEGVNTVTGAHMRVAELMRVRGAHIVSIEAVFSQLPQ